MADVSVTVEAFRALHPEVDADDDVVGKRLAVVCAAVAGLCDASGIDQQVLNLVVGNATARSLQAQGSIGITQETWGASPYSGSVTYANPAGDIYLTSFEKQLLGIDGDMEAAFVNQEPAGWADA